MVTTFSPPAKPKPKKKLPVQQIALGAVAGILLVVVFILLSKNGKESARANQLNEAVVKIAESVGTTNLTPEVLADSAAAQGALDALVVSVNGQGAELVATKTELETAKAGAARVQEELTAATEATTAAQGKADSASRDLGTRTSELQALQKKYDQDTAALNEEISALKSSSEAAAAAAAAAAAVVVPEDGEADTNVIIEVVSAETKSHTIPDNKSVYFKSFSYNPNSSNLTLHAISGGKLTYSNVPATVYDEMVAAQVFDVYFRFKLMDVYPSTPKDREFMRELN